MKDKVLFILPTLHAGGAENYALRFIRYCGNRVDFHVLAVNTSRGDLHEQFEAAGVTLHYQSIGYFDIRKLWRLRELLKKHQFSAVATFNGNFGGLPLFVARSAGIKRRISLYRRSTNAFGTNRMKLWYNAFAGRLVRRFATAVLSNSEYAFRNFHPGFYGKDSRFSVIPNGIDVAAFNDLPSKSAARKALQLPEEGIIIGHIGRFDPAKNHETIFKVIREVVSLRPDFRFLFCGKNTDSAAFRSRLQEHGIEGWVYCLGLNDDVPLVLRSLDVFYFPSVTEGQPNALIEAMVSGLPVLPSAIPPILEALPSSIHPKLFDPLEVVKVAAKLVSLAENPDEANQFRFEEWARKKFEHTSNFESFYAVLTHGI